jgi:hypothetical protein
MSWDGSIGLLSQLMPANKNTEGEKLSYETRDALYAVSQRGAAGGQLGN